MFNSHTPSSTIPSQAGPEPYQSTVGPSSISNLPTYHASHMEQVKTFLDTAPINWTADTLMRRLTLPNNESISCVLWRGIFYITGTDIVRVLSLSSAMHGRPVRNLKKFEEGVFSDLRNLKPDHDATLEEPRSEFLELLYRHGCVRTQKKQKVFHWYSVPHDRLAQEALERDLKRESLGLEPTAPLAPQSSPPMLIPPEEALKVTVVRLTSQAAIHIALAPQAPSPLTVTTENTTLPSSSSSSSYILHPSIPMSSSPWIAPISVPMTCASSAVIAPSSSSSSVKSHPARMALQTSVQPLALHPPTSTAIPQRPIEMPVPTVRLPKSPVTPTSFAAQSSTLEAKGSQDQAISSSSLPPTSNWATPSLLDVAAGYPSLGFLGDDPLSRQGTPSSSANPSPVLEGLGMIKTEPSSSSSSPSSSPSPIHPAQVLDEGNVEGLFAETEATAAAILYQMGPTDWYPPGSSCLLDPTLTDTTTTTTPAISSPAAHAFGQRLGNPADPSSFLIPHVADPYLTTASFPSLQPFISTQPESPVTTEMSSHDLVYHHFTSLPPQMTSIPTSTGKRLPSFSSSMDIPSRGFEMSKTGQAPSGTPIRRRGTSQRQTAPRPYERTGSPAVSQGH